MLSILSDEALRKHDPQRRKIHPNKEKQNRKKKLSKQSGALEKLVASEREGVTFPQKLATSARNKEHKKIISRAIPSYLRKYIWERDEGQCTYINHSTKHRCPSRYLLQIDHIQPFSLNGGAEPKNLRLLCAGHNRFRSKKTFKGKKRISCNKERFSVNIKGQVVYS